MDSLNTDLSTLQAEIVKAILSIDFMLLLWYQVISKGPT
jgi:hypothetical protein